MKSIIKKVSPVTNIIALFAALMVIVSMFLAYITFMNETVATGFELFKAENAGIKIYIVISCFLSFGVAAVALLRLVRFPFFNSKLFSFIFAIAGLALAAVALIIYFNAVNVTFGSHTVEIYGRGIGLVLNLAFSIIGGSFCILSLLTTDTVWIVRSDSN